MLLHVGRTVACVALATVGAGTAAEVGRPAAGAFAFDWLRPKSARCEAVSEALRERLRRCDRQPGAFGLSDPVHVCRVDHRTEYLVFETRAACVRNLETMKANAP